MTNLTDPIMKWRLRRDAIGRYAEPNLSEIGLRDHKDKMNAWNDRQLSAAVESARAVESVNRAVVESARKAASKIGTPAERETAWHRVEMLLRSGRTILEAVGTMDDPVEVAAIAEWGPTYLRSQQEITGADRMIEGRPLPEPEGIDEVVPAVVTRLAAMPGADPIYARAIEAQQKASDAAVWAGVGDDLVRRGEGSYDSMAALHALDDGVSYNGIAGALTPDPMAPRTPLGWSDLRKVGIPEGASAG